MSSARIAHVIAERRGDDWSAVDSTLGVGAASARSLEEARRLLRLSDPPRRAWANETDIDLLRRLGPITATGTLNQPGQLFVGRDGNADELLYVFRRSSAGELVVNEPLRGPMLSAVLRVLEMIEARVDRTPVNLPGGQQLLVADLPDAAVREVLINGVMHPGLPQSGSASHRALTGAPGGHLAGTLCPRGDGGQCPHEVISRPSSLPSAPSPGRPHRRGSHRLCHPAASSRLLADLVERQILVKTSDAQRGPSVTDGPGPALRRRIPQPSETYEQAT